MFLKESKNTINSYIFEGFHDYLTLLLNEVDTLFTTLQQTVLWTLSCLSFNHSLKAFAVADW